MEIYYFIHYGLFLSCIFYFISKKSQKYAMVFWCIFLTIVGGIRWRIGGDIDQYYDYFKQSEWSNIFTFERYGGASMEPGFVFINVLIKTLFKEFYIYNLIICGFIQYSIYKFCKYFFPNGPLLIFVFIQDMGISYFPVRAGLAIGVCYWAWRYIQERDLKKFLLVVGIAFLIHHQSIVLLPCYWLGRIKLKDWMLLCIYPIIIITGYALQGYFTTFVMNMGGDLADKAYLYTQHETDGFSGNNYIGWALNYLFLIVYIYIRNVCNFKDDVWYNCLLNAFILHNAIFIIFSDGMGDLTRLSSTLSAAKAILFGIALYYFMNSKKQALSVGAFLFYLAYVMYKIPTVWSGYFFKDTCVPYKTIFDYNLL